MSVFLVVIPKKIERQVDESYYPILDRISDTYKEIFKDVKYQCCKLYGMNSPNSGYVLIWDRIDPQSLFSSSDKESVWTVSSSMNVSESIIHNVSRRGGKLQYVNPVWGHYTVLRAEYHMNQFQAWNTIPALEAINFAEDNNFVYVSNMPLAIALAMAEGDAKNIQLNEDYISEYLAFGYSLSGKTGFKDVYVLPPTQMLNINKGAISFERSPSGLCVSLSENHSQEEGAEHLLLALKNSMDRSISQMRGEKIQLHMSGGKDSRLCALLAEPYNEKFYSVNFGQLGELESSIAAIISDEVGIPIEITSAKLSEGKTLKQKVASTIRYTDGILPSEPHLSLFIRTMPKTENESIMEGQWPLFKGGEVKRMKKKEDRIKQTLLKIPLPILNSKEMEHHNNFLMDWYSNVEARTNLEKLYLFSREFRSGRWLQGNVAMFSRHTDVLYPICDSEVTAVSDALTLVEKVSQTALYYVMNSLSSTITHLPLANSRWPAHTNSMVESFLEKNPEKNIYDEFLNIKTKPNFVHQESIDSLSLDVVSEISLSIIDSKTFSYYTKILNESFIESLQRASGGIMSPPLDMPDKLFKSAIWRLFVVDVWLSKSWLEK